MDLIFIHSGRFQQATHFKQRITPLVLRKSFLDLAVDSSCTLSLERRCVAAPPEHAEVRSTAVLFLLG
jgi:hypothetical protein